MKLASFLLFLLGTLYVDSVQSIKCQEGFNASIMGLPFYHWNERQCVGKSECFAQELEIQLPVYQLEAVVRYGGCVSRSYAPMLTCQNLFGEKSTLDPSAVFRMLPKLDGIFQNIKKEFRENFKENFHLLLSNGAGPESFIDGCYKLLSNLGLQVDKASPLKKYFVNIMEMFYPRNYFDTESPTAATMKDAQEFYTGFLQTLRNVTNEYKIMYPESEFPEIVWKLANYINSSLVPPPYSNCYSLYNDYYYNSTQVDECYRKSNEETMEYIMNTYNRGVSLSIDIQFAIFNEIDFTKMDLYDQIMKAFPDYTFFVGLFRALDRKDVKDLFKGFFDWNRYVPGRQMPAGFFERLVLVSNETVSRITSKLGEFNKELRKEFSPRSCKYFSCKSNNCNTLQQLTDVKKVLKVLHSSKEKKEKITLTANVKSSATKPTTQAVIATTTNDSTKPNASCFVNAIVLYMLTKFF